jgi:hypothetical protein
MLISLPAHRALQEKLNNSVRGEELHDFSLASNLLFFFEFRKLPFDITN